MADPKTTEEQFDELTGLPFVLQVLIIYRDNANDERETVALNKAIQIVKRHI